MINSKKNIFLFFFIILFLCNEFRNEINDFTLNLYNPVEKHTKNFTMGTTYSFQYIASSFYSGEHTLKIAKHNAKYILRGINQNMSTYLFNTSISLMNKSKKNYFINNISFNFVAYQSIKNTLKNCDFFYININKLATLWKFNQTQTHNVSPNILNICRLLNSDKKANTIYLNKYIIKKSLKSISYNLSASAKGYGVDKIYKLKKNLGFSNFICEIGGEAKVSGINFKKKIWVFGLIEPCKKNIFGQCLNIVTLYNSSLASSGMYLNTITYKSYQFSHIFNIHSGMPVKLGLANINIILKSCMIADVFSTTFFLCNLNNYIIFLCRMKLHIYLFYDSIHASKRYISKKLKSNW